jgi:AcrR family transcriptional regulator
MRPEACAAAREALPLEVNPPTPETEVREGAMEGALTSVGELGYRAASVRTILEFSGGHRRQFYEDFESKEDCFEQAYAVWIERLGVSLLEAAIGAGGWRPGVRAALIRLLAFIAERPLIARSLFVEVQVAGGRALAEHEEAIDRLAEALDSIRAELGPEEAPPESTGVFVVGGIEACVCDVLAAGDPSRVWDALPEMMHLAVGSYLGKAAAEEELEEARALLARERGALGGETA